MDRLALVAPVCDRQRRDAAIRAMREEIGDEAFDAAWAAGKNLGLEEAVQRSEFGASDGTRA